MMQHVYCLDTEVTASLFGKGAQNFEVDWTITIKRTNQICYCATFATL